MKVSPEARQFWVAIMASLTTVLIVEIMKATKRTVENYYMPEVRNETQ